MGSVRVRFMADIWFGLFGLAPKLGSFGQFCSGGFELATVCVNRGESGELSGRGLPVCRPTETCQRARDRLAAGGLPIRRRLTTCPTRKSTRFSQIIGTHPVK